MGQKIHPIGLRVGIIRGWESRWFQERNQAEFILEDYKIRKFVNRQFRHASISGVEIERANKVHVIVNTGKPGLVIGKRGSGIEELRRNLEKLTKKSLKISVKEIKQPELDAELVAQNIADALEKRVAFRRAMKQSVQRSLKAGAKGVKVQISGRLGGAEIARSERSSQGKVPLHTLRADIDYALAEARTPAGRIGVKVWLYRGEILPRKAEAAHENM
jgi:small subunit ribosomal protein S3